MIAEIRSKFKSKERKRLLSNFVSLSALQAANFILPLITIPYLLRVLGVEYFGLLALATAMIAFFGIITDYGFNLTATREISIHRDNKEKVIEIFSSVMTIKFFLMFVSFFLLTILVFSFEKLSQHWLIYFLSFGTVIGQFLFPLWFFQGMERMKYITYLNILAKSIFTLSVFIFIKEKSDFWIAPLLTSMGFIIAGICSLYLIRKRFDVSFVFQKTESLKYYLFDGWDIFLSRIFGYLYRNSNIIILGILTNNIFVGYYAIAEKVIKILQTLQDVFGNVLFPYVTKKFKNNKNYFFILNKKYLKYIFSAYAILFLMVLIFSKLIVLFLNGSYNSSIILDLQIMSLVIVIGGLNYYFGILGLVSLNYKKEFSRYIVNTGLFNVVFCTISIYLFNDLGAAIIFVLSEVVLLTQILFKINQIKRSFNA